MLKLNKSLYKINKKSYFIKKGNFNINKKINCSIIVYLQNTKSNLQCLENLQSFYHSKKQVDIVVVSDEYIKVPKMFNFFKIKPIPKLKNSNEYSTYVFLKTLEFANNFNLDYFFYYEWDCKVGKDFWYDDLWQEHLDWSDPVMTGTPVIKMPMSFPIGNFLYGIEEFRNQYSKKSSVVMAVYSCHGINKFSIHTNGALGFYKTSEMNKIFNIKINKSTIKNFSPWDDFLGIKFYKKYKEKCLNKMGWLCSSYSGCGDEFYSQHQRNFMLKSGLKSVIHQNKYCS